jgi:diacylglycerol kinase family enzyme
VDTSFAYVYDERLAERKHERELSRFEAELARLGIGGRIARLTLFRKPKDTVEDALRSGIRHLVIVGDDETFLRMMWFLPGLDVAVGFAPILGSNHLAGPLGVAKGFRAAEALAGRLYDTLDVGQVGDRYFLTDVVMPDTRAELDIEGRFRIRPTVGGTITISNVGRGDAKDGKLDVSVRTGDIPARFPWMKPQPGDETRLQLVTGRVRSEEPVTLIVDGQPLQGNDFAIKILPSKLKVIVGKGRSLVRTEKT